MIEISSGKLNGATCYLSGPMEFVADHGVAWRRKCITLCRQKGLKIDFIDPTDKPGGKDIKIGENKEHQIMLQSQGRWKELRDYVHAYRRYDLRFVDLSDFLIVVIDPTIFQCGTLDEVFLAERQHKPMFFICEGGLSKLPRWLFDVIDLEDPATKTRCNVFTSVEDCVDEIVGIDRGWFPMSSEWVLVRRHIEEQRNPDAEAHFMKRVNELVAQTLQDVKLDQEMVADIVKTLMQEAQNPS